MNSHRNWLLWGLLVVMLLKCLAAPVDLKEVVKKENPELDGGFFQGDMEIVLTRNGDVAPSKRWPNGVVHYKIDDVFDYDHSAYIRHAMNLIEENSCIRFLQANAETSAYIHYIGEPTGCHAKVGYRGKLQTLNLQRDALDTGCFKLGTIMHEILHSLGFHHQQCVPDRDDYIRIVAENIQEGKESNFLKYAATKVMDFGVAYDYASVLHYGDTAFSKNGEKTIVPLVDESIEIGQRRGLSAGDIAKLNLMYKCPGFMNNTE